MGFITAKVLYKNEEFLACTKSTQINTVLVSEDVKAAWIFPNGYGYYQLTFADPNVPGALSGVWVTQGSQAELIDGALSDVQTLLAAGTGTVTGIYNGSFPSNTGPSLATYVITRTDDGSITSLQDFMLAYLQWVQLGTLQRTYSSPTSTYTFQSYSDPQLQGNDVLSSESARLFLSNAGGSLTSGNKWSIVGYVNGDLVGAKISGATNGALSTIPALLAADPSYGALGTWTVSGTSIQLSTTTVDGVSLMLTQGT